MSSNNQPPKLDVLQVAKTFGAQRVLKSVNFSLSQGESLAVLGRSGTGKSVLFKCIVRLLVPDKGQIKIDGFILDQVSRKQRKQLLSKVAVVFQGSALFDSLPVWKNVMFSTMVNGTGGAPSLLLDQAENYLTQVGLKGDDLYKMPSELSGGMQKRVAVARALAQHPELIFFDEPTTGLDPITAGTIDDLIADVSQASGATTITITHDLNTARTVAKRAIFLESGRVHWEGQVDELNGLTMPLDLPSVLRDFLTCRATAHG